MKHCDVCGEELQKAYKHPEDNNKFLCAEHLPIVEAYLDAQEIPEPDLPTDYESVTHGQ